MHRKIEYFIKFLIAITFFVPLIVIPSGYIFPFIVPKIVWFRGLAVLMTGLFILLLASDWQKYRVKITPLTIAVTVFMASFLLSTFVGVDWYKSFWDNHERMLGLFTLLHFFVYYLIVSSVIKEWREWQWLLRIFLLAGSIVMIIGGMQKINPQMLLNQGGDRVSATLGNAIYFSGYGLFLFFVGLMLFLKEKKNNFWRYFAAVGSFLGFLGIFWGGTRGTVLGLIMGFLALCISYLITFRQHPKARKIVSLILIVGLLFGTLIVIFRKAEFVQKLPGVSRLVDTDFTIKNSTVPRVMAWGIAWEAFKDKPVFGWGPNNYYYAFNKYYRPEFLESGWSETWFDNAHNIIMNTLAVQGGVGIILYFGLFGSSLFVLWRGYKKGKVDLHLVSVSTAFLVAHFVHNITVFENPTSYLYFFFFLAFVNSESFIQTVSEKTGIKSAKDLSIGLTVVVGLITILLIYSTDINPAKANQATLNAIKNIYTDPVKAMDIYKNQASQIPTPHIDDIRNDFSRTATEIIIQLAQAKKVDLANELLNFVSGELLKNRILHPADIRVQLQQAQLALVGAQLNRDPKYLLDAEGALLDALQRSPKRQQIQYMLAPVEAQFGKGEAAIKLLRDSIENDYKIDEGWWRLAALYQEMGKNKEAREVIAEAKSRGISFSGQGQTIQNVIMGTTTKK